MNIALWIVQGILAAVFAGSAYCKGTWNRERLVRSGQTGVQGLPLPLIRLIALCELCGALGLVLPVAVGIAPRLTVLAALALSVVMLLAAGVHISLREPRNVVGNVVLLAGALFVAFSRGLHVSLG